MRKHTVYLVTNKINGLGYIGTHLTGDPLDSYMGSGNLIIQALKKYGSFNFFKEILGKFDNPYEAHYWEGFYIKLFKTLAHKGGYNISPTGGTKYGGKLSNETKIKIGKSNKNKSPWNKGLKTGPRSKIEIEKIRKKLLGQKFGKERCENISKALKKFHENKKNIIQNGNA